MQDGSMLEIVQQLISVTWWLQVAVAVVLLLSAFQTAVVVGQAVG
jgi:hypothetical protein